MGRKRIIAETGAGQQGVATAGRCVMLSSYLKCVVYMGATDVERQKPNVFRSRSFWVPTWCPVTSGATCTLKDAEERAMPRLGRQCRGTDLYVEVGTVAGLRILIR